MSEPRPNPISGEVWQHYVRGRVVIEFLGYWEPTVELSVIYRDLATGSCWIRSLESFMASIPPPVETKPGAIPLAVWRFIKLSL